MKVKYGVLLVTGFVIASAIFSIPTVAERMNNISHYIFESDDIGTLTAKGIEVSWDDAMRLVKQGHVRQAVLPHDRRIALKLDNGVVIRSREPHLGATSDVLEEAPNRRWISLIIE
jgi:hypothetical protein